MMQGADRAIVLGLYILYFSGCFMLVHDSIFNLYLKTKAYRRMKTRANIKKSPVDTHLRKLLLATLGMKVSVSRFKWFTGILFSIIFVLAANVIDVLNGMMFALMFASAPYILLRLRLRAIQSKGSTEAEKLMASLISKYKIYNLNMEDAIEHVIADGRDIRNSRKQLAAMLFLIRETRDERRIKEYIDGFAYAIGTNWSRMLANNIYMSVVKSVNVSLSLDDILNSVQNARNLQERRKRSNSEGVRLGKYATPFLYLIFLIISIHYLDISLSHFIYRQTATKEGLTMLLIISLLFIVNYVLIELIRHKKFDY